MLLWGCVYVFVCITEGGGVIAGAKESSSRWVHDWCDMQRAVVCRAACIAEGGGVFREAPRRFRPAAASTSFGVFSPFGLLWIAAMVCACAVCPEASEALALVIQPSQECVTNLVVRMPCVFLALQTMPYRLDESTGLIDYDMMEKTATLFR